MTLCIICGIHWDGIDNICSKCDRDLFPRYKTHHIPLPMPPVKVREQRVAVSLDRCFLEPGDTAEYLVNPQRAFKATHIEVDEHSPGTVIREVHIGNMIVASTYPASLKKELVPEFNEVAYPGVQIRINVTNLANRGAIFSGALVGLSDGALMWGGCKPTIISDEKSMIIKVPEPEAMTVPHPFWKDIDRVIPRNSIQDTAPAPTAVIPQEAYKDAGKTLQGLATRKTIVETKDDVWEAWESPNWEEP